MHSRVFTAASPTAEISTLGLEPDEWVLVASILIECALVPVGVIASDKAWSVSPGLLDLFVQRGREALSTAVVEEVCQTKYEVHVPGSEYRVVPLTVPAHVDLDAPPAVYELASYPHLSQTLSDFLDFVAGSGGFHCSPTQEPGLSSGA